MTRLGDPVDARADVFALGITLVEALTGRRSFERTTYAGTLAAMNQQPFQFELGDGQLALASVLRRCLAIDRAARFASVAELRRALIPALQANPPVAL
jgi:serine/threonine protein kinase